MTGPPTGPAAPHSTTDESVPDTDTAAPRFALSGVARGGALNVVAAACNQLCLFAIVTIIARELGDRAVGEYTLSWAVLVVVGMFALWGFQTVLTRSVAVHLAEGDAARLRGTLRLSMRASAGMSVALAIVIAALADPLAHVFHQPGIATQLRLVALAVPAVTIRDAALAATQGWHTQRAYALIASVFEPVLRLLLTCVVIAVGWGVTAVFAAIPIGAWSATALALLSLRRRVRSVPAADPTVDARAIWRFSTASWGMVIASTGLVWADTLILGALRSTRELGIYNISTRIVNLAVFVMVPVIAALEPQLASLVHRGDRAPLERAYSTTTRWMLALSLPAFVVLLVYAHDVLRLFGPGYTVGATVTVVLAVGQLVNGITGACGPLQNMGGFIRLNMINNGAALVLNIGLNLALIPSFGITGAAVAWSVSLAAVNIARVIENRIIFKILPIGRSLGKVAIAALVAAAVAVLVRLSIGNELIELIVGVACVVVAYVITLWLLGIEPDDRAAARSILGRAGGTSTPAEVAHTG